MIQSFEKEETEIKVLMNLGCSLSQSRVYLALAKLGTAQIALISKATGIHRENLYEILKSMIEKGLVEKETGVPTKYRIVPPDEALSLLVTSKRAQLFRLEKDIQQTIQKLNNIDNEGSNKNANAESVVVLGNDRVIKRLHKALDGSKISIDTVTTKKRFSDVIVEFSEGYKRALERGVKIRLVTEKHTPENSALSILSELMTNSNFQVRYFSGENMATTAIFDRNQAHISLSATTNLSRIEGLWSNNSCLVTLAQAFFDQQWADSKPLHLQTRSMEFRQQQLKEVTTSR